MDFMSPSEIINQLSVTQLKVIQRQAAGISVKAIADELGLSPKTVEYHSLNARRIIGHESLVIMTRWLVANKLVPKLHFEHEQRIHD